MLSRHQKSEAEKNPRLSQAPGWQRLIFDRLANGRGTDPDFFPSLPFSVNETGDPISKGDQIRLVTRLSEIWQRPRFARVCMTMELAVRVPARDVMMVSDFSQEGDILEFSDEN
jgi:hypothetical protein